MKAVNSYHKTMRINNTNPVNRTARASMDSNQKDIGIPTYLNAPVYQENKQFFYDLAYAPMSGEMSLKTVNKDVINESVYGSKWRERMNSSALTETTSHL